MKHLFITLFLFLLISIGKISAQSFDVKFSGVETNIVAGTETYVPEYHSVYSQLVAFIHFQICLILIIIIKIL